MKNKEIEELLNKLKDKDWYEELDLTGTKWIELRQEETNLLLSYIEQLENNRDKDYVLVGRMQLKTRDYIHQLEKENQQLKKQKDDVVEYIKENENEYGSLLDNEKIILRMLGEEE